MLRSSADAEDAVQDVFVSLVRGRHRIAAVEDLTAYLLSSLRHAIGRRMTQRAAERRGLETLARLSRDDASEPTAWPDDELERALADLPDEQREVIAMKTDAGLTFAQIAAILNCSPNTAASRYRYALEKLRRQLRRD